MTEYNMVIFTLSALLCAFYVVAIQRSISKEYTVHYLAKTIEFAHSHSSND